MIYSIQYLRAFAVILVCYCHVIDHLGNSYQANFYYLSNFGAIGVDIFFVISGFIISIICKDIIPGLKSSFKFLKNRFIRINLIYYFITLIYIFLNIIFFKSEISNLSLVKSIIILPIFDQGNQFIPTLFLGGWTLCFEWLFYIIYSMLIGISVIKRELILILFLVLLCFVGSLFPYNYVQFKFITNPIILEFVLGLLIASIYNWEISKKRVMVTGYFLFFLAVLIFMFLIFFKNDLISEQTNILKGIGSSKRFLFWGIPSGILVLSLVFIEKSDIGNFPKVPFLINLGEASYSIYLTHQLCLYFYLSTNKRIHAINIMNEDFKILALTIILLFFGYVFHKYFEIPFLKYAKNITK